MKKSDMVEEINAWLDTQDVVNGVSILRFLEAKGMLPPTLPQEHCQAISDIYYAGYTLNQWEEDFDKNIRASEHLAHRLARKNK